MAIYAKFSFDGIYLLFSKCLCISIKDKHLSMLLNRYIHIRNLYYHDLSDESLK